MGLLTGERLRPLFLFCHDGWGWGGMLVGMRAGGIGNSMGAGLCGKLTTKGRRQATECGIYATV